LSTTFAGEWTGRDVTVDEVARELASLRGAGDGGPDLRTSVMTHVAWVPPTWEDRARAVFADLGRFYPSRTILLLPRPDEPDGLHSKISMQCFPTGGSEVCTELVELELCGARAEVPASVVVPLLLSDLPVFLRWRGLPPFGDPTFERLAALVDRLVVDSREWDGGLHASYGSLAQHFGDHLAVSDIVWARSLPWREAVAAAWPGIAEASELEIEGPEADALLLAGWLRSRLGRPVALEQRDAGEIASVSVDGESVAPPNAPPPRPGELLSQELDRFGRDAVYEAAVRAAAGEHVHHTARA
jgi:hypothetical protein